MTRHARSFTTLKSLQSVERRRQTELRAVGDLKQDVRAAIALLSSILTEELLELGRVEQRRAQDLQTAVTYVSAVLLAPGLVAAFFGAVPSVFDKHPTLRLLVIVGVMGVAGVASFYALRRIQQRSRCAK